MADLTKARYFMVSHAAKESSYATAATLSSRIPFGQEAFVSHAPETETDAALLGGALGPTKQYLLGNPLEGNLPLPLCTPHELAFIVAYGLGSVVTTTPDGGTKTRRHRMTPKRGSSDLPTFSMQEYKTSAVQVQYRGSAISDFEMSMTRQANRIVTASATMLAGRLSTGTANVGVIDEEPLNADNSRISMGTFDGGVFKTITEDHLVLATQDVGTGYTDLTEKVNSLNLTWANNINRDRLYTMGSGTRFGSMRRGTPTLGLALNLDYEGQDYVTALSNQTDLALQWKIRGPNIEGSGNSGFYYGLNLIFPRLRVGGHTYEAAGDDQGEALTLTVLDTDQRIVVDEGTNGATDSAGTDFTSAGATFTNGADQVLEGDQIEINNRTLGVDSVDNNTGLTLDATAGASLTSQEFKITRDPLPWMIIDIYNEQTAYAA